eukprot:358614-Chlamydomonas_euryale.AAC.5
MGNISGHIPGMWRGPRVLLSEAATLTLSSLNHHPCVASPTLWVWMDMWWTAVQPPPLSCVMSSGLIWPHLAHARAKPKPPRFALRIFDRPAFVRRRPSREFCGPLGCLRNQPVN